MGYFLEVEKIVNKNSDFMKVKNEIREFIRKLNLKNAKEINMGKNQLMYKNKIDK